ncbi:hypothetical protein CRG98_049971 [Punica granatum]|uniref:Pentatricopeptide repeat-containing protein n=1 Tax=Punica granatum TaxID=22663 RepID=A0A2I0H214_PUNGR|nr:hypothetical protein CRG98_049971 [Punica granatum]
MTDARRVFDEMEVKDVLVWTTLVSGYARSGYINRASEIFHEMPVKNPISWIAMIAGYMRNGLSNIALKLFSRMTALWILLDQFTFSRCLCAYARFDDLKRGKQIHAHLIRTNFRANTIVVGSLVDMYSKCGNLGYAQLIFYRVNDKKEVPGRFRFQDSTEYGLVPKFWNL